MNKIIWCLLFTMTTFCSTAQNKKEQIEALNFSIDSLNNLSKVKLDSIERLIEPELLKLKVQIGDLNNLLVTAIIGKTSKIRKLEIAEYDFPNQMGWRDAINKCQELGYGWRLPTKKELKKMYKTNQKIGNFKSDNFYWTYTKSDQFNDWRDNFSFRSRSHGKLGDCFARAVRDL